MKNDLQKVLVIIIFTTSIELCSAQIEKYSWPRFVYEAQLLLRSCPIGVELFYLKNLFFSRCLKDDEFIQNR